MKFLALELQNSSRGDELGLGTSRVIRIAWRFLIRESFNASLHVIAAKDVSIGYAFSMIL